LQCCWLWPVQMQQADCRERLYWLQDRAGLLKTSTQVQCMPCQ
jgi:hypothetical protein